MILLNDILVATDFSPPSEAALTYGRALAGEFGSVLHVLHAVENPFLRPTAADPHQIERAAAEAIERRLTVHDRRTLHARPVIEISDSAAEAITDYAKASAVGLIVIGTHGRSAVSQFLVGSVAERVVRTAPCPVLIVRHPEHDFVEESTMIRLKQIVVATDFGDAAEAAVEYGREFARTFGAKLIILNVVDNVLTRPYAAEGYIATYPQLQQELESAALHQLDALVSEDDRLTLDVGTVVLKSNDPATAIVNYARDEKVDIVIMGTHGRSTVAHIVMGNVAERVVRLAPCPVLTVRHPEREFIRPDALVAVASA